MLTVIDVALIAPSTVFAVIAFARGFLRSISNLIAWVVAPVVTLWAFRPAEAFFGKLIDSGLIVGVLALSIPFVVSLLALQFVFGLWVTRVRLHFPKRIDHILGALWGLAVGILLTSVAWVALNSSLDIRDHPFVEDSLVVPVIDLLNPVSSRLIEYSLPSWFRGGEEANTTNTPLPPQGVRPLLGESNRPRAPSLPGGGGQQSVPQGLDNLQRSFENLRGGGRVAPNLSDDDFGRIQDTFDSLLDSVIEADPATPAPSDSPSGIEGAFPFLQDQLEKNSQSNQSNQIFLETLPPLEIPERENLPQLQDPAANRYLDQLHRGIRNLERQRLEYEIEEQRNEDQEREQE